MDFLKWEHEMQSAWQRRIVAFLQANVTVMLIVEIEALDDSLWDTWNTMTTVIG
jgi:hypothetical protein